MYCLCFKALSIRFEIHKKKNVAHFQNPSATELHHRRRAKRHSKKKQRVQYVVHNEELFIIQIASIKGKIEALKTFPAANQKLIHSGKDILNANKLSWWLKRRI